MCMYRFFLRSWREFCSRCADEAEGILGPTVAQSLAAARQHADASVRDMAESIMQLARRLQSPANENGATLSRWLYHAGRVASNSMHLAVAGFDSARQLRLP